MEERLSEIFSRLPYNSYEDLINSILNQKATFKFMRSECSQIAGVKHPYFSVLGLYIGFLITMIFLIYFSIKLKNFWLLLFIPVNFILSNVIVYMPKLKKIAWIILIIDLFLIRFSNFILIACLDIIAISFFYNFWWNTIYHQAFEELMHNKEAFLWAWDRNGIAIEDCYGNIYNNLSINRNENIENQNI